jgi:hypothetical protein
VREPVFFLDRSLGRKIVAEKMRAHGLHVEIHVDHFPKTEREPEANDETWLREVGKRGWVILSKDQHLHRNQIEISGLLGSGAPSFVLTAGTMGGDQMAETFIKAMPAIRRFLDRFEPPFLAKISATGRVSLFLSHSDLIKRLDLGPQ